MSRLCCSCASLPAWTVSSSIGKWKNVSTLNPDDALSLGRLEPFANTVRLWEAVRLLRDDERDGARVRNRDDLVLK